MSIKKINVSAMVARAAELPDSAAGLTHDKWSKARENIAMQPNMPPPEDVGAAIVADKKTPLSDAKEEYEVIPLSEIDENPFNARKFYNKERIEKLTVSIAADGQLQPGLATIRAGRYILIGGHYRIKALKKANVATMKLVIKKDVKDCDLYRLSYVENVERSNQTCIDNAYSWKQLLDEKIYLQDRDLAEAISVSPAIISKTLALLKLSSSIVELANAHPDSMGISILYELQLLEATVGTEMALEMAQKIIDGIATRAEITRLRTMESNNKVRKTHSSSRQYLLNGPSGKVGFIKEWPQGRVQLDVTIDDPEAKQALLEELKARFNVS